MKILSVVGARPQFVKLAPMARALATRCTHKVVHTGQHYDPNMSDVFFSDLGIPRPDHHLEVGSASHGAQTGRMLEELERVFQLERPDAALVYGDTNSTLAATLAAVKLHIPVIHLEAGLRSFNRSMPEEHNRVLTDHASDLCLAPTALAMRNLAHEGLDARSILVGDVMTDVLFGVRDRVAGTPSPLALEFDGAPFTLATLHRPSNTDDPEQLMAILAGLQNLDKPTLLLAHPRLRAKAAAAGISLDRPGIVTADPAGYSDLVRLLLAADSVVTDSGGLQKEAFLLRKPCVTVRTDTEWSETIDLGWNALAGDRPAEIATRLALLPLTPTDAEPYGDGTTATQAADAMLALVAAA